MKKATLLILSLVPILVMQGCSTDDPEVTRSTMTTTESTTLHSPVVPANRTTETTVRTY